jgi:hypothetical protein
MTKTKYDERHGGPFDRGGADYWYHRGWEPHYYKGRTYTSERVGKADMTAEEIAAYDAGYEAAKAAGGQKDWGQ